jgi:hypothetical protein
MLLRTRIFYVDVDESYGPDASRTAVSRTLRTKYVVGRHPGRTDTYCEFLACEYSVNGSLSCTLSHFISKEVAADCV